MAQTSPKKPLRPRNDPVDPTDASPNPESRPRPTPTVVPEALIANPAYAVDSQGEVRAGPGDAGAQDAPRVLDNPQDEPTRGPSFAIGAVVVIAIIIFASWMIAL